VLKDKEEEGKKERKRERKREKRKKENRRKEPLQPTIAHTSFPLPSLTHFLPLLGFGI
jgi:hypothetical protein